MTLLLVCCSAHFVLLHDDDVLLQRPLGARPVLHGGGVLLWGLTLEQRQCGNPTGDWVLGCNNFTLS